MRWKAILCLLLAAATLAVYWPVRHYGYIDFDDPQYVQHNERVNHGLTVQSLHYAFTTPVVANWHPVTTLSHILDCQFFGVHAGPQHMVNVALHIANSLLLFLLLLRLNAVAGGNPKSEFRGPKEGRSASAKATANRNPKSEGETLSTNPSIHPPSSSYGAASQSITPPPQAAWLCFFVAALFALHPLRVESVAWISERKDVLSGFFFILTLWAYVRYTGGCKLQVAGFRLPEEKNLQPSTFNLQPRFLYVLALLLFAFGLMSKPMLVTTPVLLLLLDFWPLQRLDNRESNNPSVQQSTSGSRIRHHVSRTILEKLPFFALAALFSLATFFVQRGSGAVTPLTAIPLADRLENAIVSYLRYLAKLLWPTRLAAIYPHPAAHYFPVDRWPEWQTPLIVLLLLAITTLALLWVRRRPYFAFGWFWYLISMLPVIGLIQVGEQAMADRYTYIPMIGPVIALVWLLCEAMASCVTRLRRPVLRSRATAENGGFAEQVVLSAVAAVILVSCAILTRGQVGYWRSTTALFEHAVAVTGGNPSAQFSVGVGLEKEGLTNQAIVRYRAAMAIAPRDQQIHSNLAHLLREQGFLDQAIEQYEAALALNPMDVASELNLAGTLGLAGRTQQAAAHFEAALRLDPNSVEALNNLAWLLSTSSARANRDGDRAVQLAQRACELTHFKETQLIGTLAAAYAEAGKFVEAADTAEQACALAAASGQPQLAEKNRELLALYRKGQAYHEATLGSPSSQDSMIEQRSPSPQP